MKPEEIANEIQLMSLDVTTDELIDILDRLLSEVENLKNAPHSWHFRMCIPILGFNAICDLFGLNPTEWDGFAERYELIKADVKANLKLTEEAFEQEPSESFLRAKELSLECFYWTRQ